MSTLIKLAGWFKGHWKLLAIIGVIAVVAIASIQSCRISRLVKQHHELKGKLTEQKADQDTLYEKMKGDRQERLEAEIEEKRKRKDLEARIQKFQKDTVIAKKALKKEKEKTATLEPTELVAQIVERIGFESDLLKSGLYLFTRKGAERTLDRFKDGEFYLSEYNKFQGVIADHKLEVESFNESIGECEKAVATNLTGWDDCRETLATAMEDIATLEKIKKSGVWRGVKKGVFWTSVFFGGLKLFGVW